MPAADTKLRPAAISALLDDAATPLPIRKFVSNGDDLPDLRTRPWWSMCAAAAEMMAEGKPVVLRRASVLVEGRRVADAALVRTRTREEMAELETTAALIAAESGATRGPPVVVPSLPLAFPSDAAGPPTVLWGSVEEFVRMMGRWWGPGWSVRRALSGEAPEEGECLWSCRLQSGRGTHDVSLIASPV